MRYLLIFLIFLSVTTLSIAQTASSPTKKHSKKTPEQRAENKADKLTQELSLTAEQTQQLKAIFLECDVQLDSLNKQEKAVKAKREADLKKVLTPDQYNAYKDAKSKKKENNTAVPPATGTTNTTK